MGKVDGFLFFMIFFKSPRVIPSIDLSMILSTIFFQDRFFLEPLDLYFSIIIFPILPSFFTHLPVSGLHIVLGFIFSGSQL